MKQERSLRITPAHAAGEHQGSILGLDVALFPWVALGLLASLSLFAALLYNTDVAFARALSIGSLPAVVVYIYLRLAHQGRPPGLVFQWIEQCLTSGHAVPPRHPPKHIFHDNVSLS